MTRRGLLRGVAAVSVLAGVVACASAVSFIDEARDFAVGSWACTSEVSDFSVAVEANGKAFFKADGSADEPFELSWALDGQKLTVRGPEGDMAASGFDLSKLEAEQQIERVAASGESELFGGAPGSFSLVEWSFEKKTVSFQADGDPGVVSCLKFSEENRL